MQPTTSRNLSILVGALIIAGAVAWGFWYISRNSVYEQCVNARAELRMRTTDARTARLQAVVQCSGERR